MSLVDTATLAARLRLLEAALAYRAPRVPPPGVPFEDFARQVLGGERRQS